MLFRLYTPVLHPIFPRTPGAETEIIRCLSANQVHGNFTPAGSSASSVEKYHYRLNLSSPYPKQQDISERSRSRSPSCIPLMPYGRWFMAYRPSARDSRPGSGNVSDE